MFGSTCSMRDAASGPCPPARAASTKSRAQIALAEPRDQRANSVRIWKMPMATIEVDHARPARPRPA